ncbi:MAG: hypothetical protein Q4E11_00085 [Corynebacterium sp.]|uniref:hypothetical protein n=1 Tax=Corynebacterium sp. TaxID=1720 RepID=UPI0026DCB96A|nr:hypothetical protein [Corynebacterium sp.]MDO5028971.1 hypothetical protein [Corynebacterium sp.]
MSSIPIGSVGELAGAVASIVATLISFFALKMSKEASEDVNRIEQRKQEFETDLHNQKMDFERQRAEWEHQATIAAHEQQQSFQELQNRWHISNAKRDEDRRKREAVAGVTAWWGIREIGAHKSWGLVIVNEGPYAGPLGTISIKAKGKGTHKEPVSLQLLPPGQYFVESQSGSSGSKKEKWGKPELISANHVITPLTYSKNFVVEEFTFRDHMGQQWQWNSNDGWHNC